MPVRRITPTDKLETGFRAIYNQTVDAIVDATGCVVTDEGVLEFYNDLGDLLGSVDLAPYFKLKNEMPPVNGGEPVVYPWASEEVRGLIKLATTDDVIAGEDSTRALTPALLKFFIENFGGLNPDLLKILRTGSTGDQPITLIPSLTGILPYFALKVKNSVNALTELLGIRAIDKDTASIDFKSQPRQVFEDDQVQFLSDVKVSDFLTANQAAVKIAPLVNTAEFKLVTHYDPQRGYVIERQLNTDNAGGGKEYDETTPILVRDLTEASNESVQTANWQFIVREKIAPGRYRTRTITPAVFAQEILLSMSEDDLRAKYNGGSDTEVAGDARLPAAIYCRDAPTPAFTTQVFTVTASMFGTPQLHNLQTTGANIFPQLLTASNQPEQNVLVSFPDAAHFLLTPASSAMTDWTGKLRLDKTVTS